MKPTGYFVKKMIEGCRTHQDNQGGEMLFWMEECRKEALKEVQDILENAESMVAKLTEDHNIAKECLEHLALQHEAARIALDRIKPKDGIDASV